MMETPQITALVELVARIDAGFIPMRNWKGRCPVNAGQFRLRYGREGAVWLDSYADGEAGTARKREERLRDSLEAEGMIRLVRTVGAKATRAVVTELGDAIARMAAGIPTMEGALDLLDMLWARKESADGFDYDGLAFAREVDLMTPPIDYASTSLPGAAGRDVRNKLIAIENIMLPALVAGLAVGASDTEGRVSYALAGELAGPGPMPSQIINAYRTPKNFKRDKRLRRVYNAALEQALGHLQSAAPESRNELGLIPIPTTPRLRGQKPAATTEGAIA
jgi:hypothetical protein